MTTEWETRSRATELKFVVDAAVGVHVRAWARAHLVPDPFGTGGFADEYHTTSLYWDTVDRDVYYRRGSFARAKYRIRRYGDSPLVYLERKLRRSARVIKRRTAVPVVDLGRLTGALVEDPWPGNWFHRRLEIRQLCPACQVSYRRMARTTARNGASARLTLDDDIRAVPVTRAGFVSTRGMPVLPEQVILELKFQTELPAAFKQLLEIFRLDPQTTSKYRVGIAAVEGLPAPDVQPSSERSPFDRDGEEGHPQRP